MDERAELEALLVEYEALLSDERSYGTTLATLASVVLALVAFIAAGSLGSEQVPVCRPPNGSTCTYFRLFSPLAPLVVILYVEVIGVIAAIRSFQLRLVEERIRDLLPEDVGTRPPVASSVTTLLGFTSLRRGARTFRLLYFTILVILATLFIGVVGFSISDIESDRARHFGYAFYSVMGVLVAATAAAWLGTGPSLWRATYRRARERYGERMEDVLTEPRRRLTPAAVGYLLLPRPLDLAKGLCALGSGVFVYFAIGDSAQSGAPADALSRLLIAILLFELLAYQARYQLNDVRGLPADLTHRARAHRRRLTLVVDAVGMQSAIKVSLRVVLLRLILFVGLAFATLPERAPWITISAAAVAFVIAIPYEWLREKSPNSRAARAAALHRVIYLYVGAGYAVRAALGVLVVTDGVPFAPLALVCLAVMLLGGMFVTMTWALEGTSALRGPAHYAAFDNTLDLKSHIKPLTKAAVGKRRVPMQPTSWKILRDVSDRRFGLVWNRFLVAAAACGALAAAVTYTGEAELWVVTASITAAVATAWLLSSATTQLSMALIMVAFGSGGAVLALASDGNARAFSMSFALLSVFFLTYTQFRGASYDDLFLFYAAVERVVAAVARLPKIVRGSLAVTLIGEKTLRLLQAQQREQVYPADTGVSRPGSGSVGADVSSPYGETQREALDAPPADLAPRSSSVVALMQASRIVVSCPNEAWSVIRTLAPTTLVVDVEPFVCDWATSDDALSDGVANVLDRCCRIPSVRNVVFATNSRREPSALPLRNRPTVRYVASARKPFIRKELSRLEYPVVVCGDQALTDGLLAWLLGAIFVQTGTASSAPLWVKIQSHLGRFVPPLLFTTYKTSPP